MQNVAICPLCSKLFVVNKKGRKRTYCSESCRVKARRRSQEDTDCVLCNLQRLLRTMMAQIESLPEDQFWELINAELTDAFNSLDNAHGYATHEHIHVGGAPTAMITPTIPDEHDGDYDVQEG